MSVNVPSVTLFDMKWENLLTETLHITYPFVLAPMLGVTTPEMVAAVSNAGGLGSLPVGGLSPEKTAALIQKTKSLTDRPFAVNVFAHSAAYTINEEAWNSMQHFLEEFSRKYDLPYSWQSAENLQFFSYEDQLDLLLKERIPVLSFTFGILGDDAIDTLHENQILLAGTATSVEEARLLDDKGIDIITAQGIEAGGHRGTFLHNEPPETGLIALLPQIVDAVDVPVLAAGGIADGRCIKAVMALGAEGVQVGSAFIATKESAANPVYKEAIYSVNGNSTVLTRAYTGRMMRCLKNEFLEAFESANILINDYPVQGVLTRYLRALHENKNAIKYLPMLSGQNVRKSDNKSAGNILLEMVGELDALEAGNEHG